MKLDIVEAAENNNFIQNNDIWVREGHGYIDELELVDTAQGLIVYLTRYNQNGTQTGYKEFKTAQTGQMNQFYRAIA